MPKEKYLFLSFFLFDLPIMYCILGERKGNQMTTMIQVGKVFKVYGYKNGRKVLLGTFKTSDAAIMCMNAHAS